MRQLCRHKKNENPSQANENQNDFPCPSDTSDCNSEHARNSAAPVTIYRRPHKLSTSYSHELHKLTLVCQEFQLVERVLMLHFNRLRSPTFKHLIFIGGVIKVKFSQNSKTGSTFASGSALPAAGQ